MEETARASATNGIWLCESCAKVIDDSADDTYTPELLHHWQDQAAERTARQARASTETVEALLTAIEEARVSIFEQIAEWRERDPHRENPSGISDREAFFRQAVAFGELRHQTFETKIAPLVSELLAQARTILLPHDPTISEVEFELRHAYVNDIGMDRLAQRLRDLAATLKLW